MKKLFLVGTAVILCCSFLIVLGLVYMVSPRTVKSLFFIGQGWCCHYLASGLDTVNLVPQFEQFQKCSVDAYGNAYRNLNSEQLLALKQDEEGILAYHYIRNADYKAGMPLLDEIESECRKQLRTNFAGKDRWFRFMAGILRTHARVLVAENKPALALYKYKECFGVYEQLIRLDATDEISKKNLANAKIEAEKIGGSKPN